jgi:hypothetical protein
VRVPGNSAGSHTGGGAGTVHHTSEGSTAAGCIMAVRAANSWPHLTAEWTGARLRVFQHLPFDLAARTLKHPSGPETNRANKVQIEHVGFTDEAWRRRVDADPDLHVSRWTDARWSAIGALCRDIERLTGCPPRSAVPLAWWEHPQRMSGAAFYETAGHSGHCHVPGNDHGDGRWFDMALILETSDEARRTLRPGDMGADVTALQLAVRLRASRCGRKDHMPKADGVYGPKTARDAAFVAYILGVGEDQASLLDGGLSPYVQRLVRDPSLRNGTQRRRAVSRRAKHCKGA